MRFSQGQAVFTWLTFHARQMEVTLAYVAKKERFDLPPEAAAEIIKDSNGNMRKAILVLEALKMQSQVFLISLCTRSDNQGLVDRT